MHSSFQALQAVTRASPLIWRFAPKKFVLSEKLRFFYFQKWKRGFFSFLGIFFYFLKFWIFLIVENVNFFIIFIKKIGKWFLNFIGYFGLFWVFKFLEFVIFWNFFKFRLFLIFKKSFGRGFWKFWAFFFTCWIFKMFIKI